MSSETMRNNTIELEGIREMVNNLPDAGSVSGIDPDLNLLVLGDSLFGNDNGKIFLKGLGCTVHNYAVAGASLAKIPGNFTGEKDSNNNPIYNNILQQLKKFVADMGPGYQPDAILIDGGGNDYIHAAVMGTLGNYPGQYNPRTVDETTVMGGLEMILYVLNNYYPKAQKFFLIMHRVFAVDKFTLKFGLQKYWPADYCYARVEYTRKSDGAKLWGILFNKEGMPLTSTTEIKNAAQLFVQTYETNGAHAFPQYDKASLYVNGDITTDKLDSTKFQGHYSYSELRENIVKACQLYGFKIIDIYNDSCINALPLKQVTLEPVAHPKTGEPWWSFWNPYANKNAGAYEGVGIEYENKNGNNEELFSTIRANGNKIKVANLEFFDYKGIHPTALGYEIGYEPYVRQALSLATKKTDT